MRLIWNLFPYCIDCELDWKPSTPSHSTHEPTTKPKFHHATHKGQLSRVQVNDHTSSPFLWREFSTQNSPSGHHSLPPCHPCSFRDIYFIMNPHWKLPKDEISNTVVISLVSPLNNDFSRSYYHRLISPVLTTCKERDSTRTINLWE